MSIKYIPKLDGIRFIAIMSVITAHFAPSIGNHFSAAFYGVNLFFVLSGYLITNILISSKYDFGKSYLNFVARRALRIFPAYYLTVAILFFLDSEMVKPDLPYILTYTYNYSIDYSKPFPDHIYFWSLAVEEQFYLIFPLIVLSLRKKQKILIGVFFLIISFAFILVFIDLLNLRQYNYVGLHTNMAPLTLGALGALINKDSKHIKFIFNNIYIEILLILALLFILKTQNWNSKIIFSSILNMFIILKASTFNFKIGFLDRFLQNKVVVYVGKVSYGVYLYHGIVGRFIREKLFNPFWESIPFNNFRFFSFIQYWDWVFRLLSVTAASVLVASVSFNLFEKQFLILKNKYFQS
jgi:peptidoglycan/LPS O-acetylase OafA/YrhL